MPHIQRADLELLRSPKSMRRLILDFANDRQTYSDSDVHMRRGIAKTILEEYRPLAALVAELPFVRRARLTPQSTEGCDAEIWLWPCRRIGIEITCADQSHDAALQREELAAGKAVFPFRHRRRDTNTQEILAEGRALACPESVVMCRVERIRKAIAKKCADYRGNAEILLVADKSADWEYLKQASFVRRVREMFQTVKNAAYSQVYVCFGDAVVSLCGGDK